MERKKVKLSTEFIKLDSLLKFAGLCMTGGEATNRILIGEVLVQGEVCLQRGRKIRSGDTVQLDGMIIEVE